MKGSGLTNAPLAKWLMVGVIASSVLVSVLDTKYLFSIQVQPHLWTYWQLWRLATWQICYANSTEVMFGALTLYNMRIVERAWGTRKLSSFLVCTLPYTCLLPPLILALVLRPLSFGSMNYLPSGPTTIIFSILAQYYAAVPHTYLYRIYTSPKPKASESAEPRLILSDKSYVYVPAAQLALSQFPYNLLPAALGWTIGYAYRSDFLPGRATRWRLPKWLSRDAAMDRYEREMGLNIRGPSDVGEGSSSGVWPFGSGGQSAEAERYQGLRRRLEAESRAAADAAGLSSRPISRSEGATGGNDGQQGLATQLLDRFRQHY